MMDLGLKGKVALVAASSKGLGFGVAQALAREGARVSMCSRSALDIQAAATRLTDETGAETLGIACDLSQAESIKAWIDETVTRWGGIDALLVNNGGPPAGLFMDFDDAKWQAAFELTLMSSVRMIRSAVPYMTNGGAILTITSSSVQEPIERLVLSTVMRSGVVGLVKTLADELAGSRIRVNNLVPGRLDTERVEQIDTATAKRLNVSVEDARAMSIAKIPLGRYGRAEELGAAAAFLLSPAAEFITGATLRIDGGMIRSI